MNRGACHPLPAVMHERVLDKLGRIERKHDVVVFYACESDGRTWGFVSPDSDYDVRFVYMHQPEWYQRVEEPRDVVEHPLSDKLDISGWKLRKVLRLVRKSDPALLGWLGPPLVYRKEPGVREELLWLGNAFRSVPSSHHHYLSMARKNYRGYLKGDSVRLRKYLYVLHPLFTVRWLDAGLDLLPMAFERLVEATLGDPSLREELNALLSLRRQRDRSVYGPPYLALQCFTGAELLQAERGTAQPTGTRQGSQLLDRYLRDKIWQYMRETS